MGYGAGLPGYGAGRGTGYGAGAGGRYGAGTGSGYGAGLAADWTPLSLSSSLAAWYKADAGCYTDAACLFASASSQYLSKTSPTFAPTTKMTIAFDWKPTTVGTASDLMTRWDGSDDQFIVRFHTTGIIRFIVATAATDGAGNLQSSATALTAGVNYRIVIVYDGTLSAASRVKIYVNGTDDTGAMSGTVPASLRSSAATLMVGGRGATLPSNGALARLGFSSLALSGAALTAAHTSTFWADMTAARQADWFSFYNLCEASGTRVDSTGLNNLTPTNGPTVAAGPGEGLCVNNSPRKRINDYSGNARHRTQATIGKQPLYLDAIQNGRAVGRFDGANDYDQVLANFATQPFTIFTALKMADVDSQTQIDGADIFNRTLLTHGSFVAGEQTIRAGSNVGGAHTAGAFHVYEALYNGASSALTIDGTLLASGDAGALEPSSGLTFGANYDGSGFFSAMDECETFIVVGAMTTAQKASARAYLKQRWGTP